jgi:hypothetical protein
MPVPGTPSRMANVLAYWHAVEMFDPHDIPRIPSPRQVQDRQEGTDCVEPLNVISGQPLPTLPWQPSHPRYGEPPRPGTYGSIWRHTVYGGIFDFAAVRTALAHRLRYTESEDFGGRLDDAQSALFAFTVSERGILLDNSMAFSSCAWATGRLYRPGAGAPGWLDGFEEMTSDCEALFSELLTRHMRYLPVTKGPGWREAVTDILGPAAAGAVSSVISAMAPALGGVAVAGALGGVVGSLLQRAAQPPTESASPEQQPVPEGPGLVLPDVIAFAAHVADRFGLPSGLARHLELRITSAPVPLFKDGSPPDPEPIFLSSPVAPDLKRVADSVASGDVGPALRSYLSSSLLPPERRSDILEDRPAVLRGLSPEAFPQARWPQDTDKPLVAGQQFAVNTILGEVGGDQGGLFAVNGPPGTGKTTLLRDLIAAIVVKRAERLASLPRPDDAFLAQPTQWKTGSGWRRNAWQPDPVLSGFEIVVASSNNAAVENITKELPLLTAIGGTWHDEADYFSDLATAFIETPSWGMVAAPLGNASKRKELRENWFWRRKTGDGMYAVLQKMESNPPPLSEWQQAQKRFCAAVEVERALAAQRAAAWKSRCEPVSEATVRDAADQVRLARVGYDGAFALYQQAEHEVDACTIAVRWLQEEQSRHEAARPRGLTGWLGVGDQVRRWRTRAAELVREAAAADDKLRSARSRRDQANEVVGGRSLHLRQTEATAADLAARRAEDLSRIEAARQAWDSHFPEAWLGLDQEEQELASPWSDPEWSAARAKVFLAALDLHRAFVAGTATKIRKNLQSLFELLKRAPGAPSTPAAQAAVWQTLFLVLPVISTTFASCGRIFEGLGPQSLGWVLIDEAGQALPQHAAGALWRAGRGVVVGDPLQLQPICQVPGQAQERLRDFFGADRRWLPSAGSAQTLADEQNRWGTHVLAESEDGEAVRRWVGAPLRVHRRCEQPMFDVSNAIAYQGRMVYGTRETPFPGDGQEEYPRSSWLDVSGPSKGKWVPAHGGAMLAILRRLHLEAGVDLDRVYVLSPFRDVIKGCRDEVRQARYLTGDTVEEFIGHHIGTVHTMQGKEADVVIFVLGTDPSPGKKARDWAAHPVNLLNVAVSRARRRLFVIGDYAEWSEAPNFAVLAGRLPVHRWQPPE